MPSSPLSILYNAASFPSHPARLVETPLPTQPPRKAILEMLFFFFPLSLSRLFFKSFFSNKQPISPHLGCELGASSSAPNAQRLLFINASKPKIPSRAAGIHPGGYCIQEDGAPPKKPLFCPPNRGGKRQKSPNLKVRGKNLPLWTINFPFC